MFYIQLCWEAPVTVQPCSHVTVSCKVCIMSVHVSMPVCVCVWESEREGEREAVEGSQGHAGLDGKTPGLEARAQVHHCRRWEALQKAIGLSAMLASVSWTVLLNSLLSRHSCTTALVCLLHRLLCPLVVILLTSDTANRLQLYYQIRQ